MKAHKLTQLAIGALAAVLIPALHASASQQAVVTISYKNQFAVGTTFTAFTGAGIVTVNTTSPPASVMWPANIISGSRNFTYIGPFTPFASVVSSYGFVAGTISKSQASAAPSGGSTLMGVTATTKCFKSTATAMPGPPALPGSCFPRRGTGLRIPGTNRFGGTARVLRVGTFLGTLAGITGSDLFVNNVFRTPALEGPSAIGNYGIHGTGTFTNTVTGVPRRTVLFDTSAPLTTGQVTVMGGDFGTFLTITGSNNLNTTNLTGTISLVQPVLRNQFSRNAAGVYLGNTLSAEIGRTVSITFLPEPGATIALACGFLGLGALVTFRRR